MCRLIYAILYTISVIHSIIMMSGVIKTSYGKFYNMMFEKTSIKVFLLVTQIIFGILTVLFIPWNWLLIVLSIAIVIGWACMIWSYEYLKGVFY